MPRGGKANPRPVRAHPFDSTLALVELTRGYFAVISGVDAVDVGRFGWCISGDRKYATRTSHPKIYLHQLVGSLMGLSGIADHEDTDGLNCRRSNLRSATPRQNSWNARKRRDNTSGVKGVTWDAQTGKWRAAISVNGKPIRLGRFSAMASAASAVMEAREKLHGEFANHGVN